MDTRDPRHVQNENREAEAGGEGGSDGSMEMLVKYIIRA